MKYQIRKSIIAVAVMSACSASGVMAQTGIEIEEIIVTANKREQSLQQIPAAITAMSGDMLEDRGIQDATDLQRIVPSMVTGSGNRGDATINIRGVGYNEVGDTGVALHVDGVYQPRPRMGQIAQIDLERVEVLSGPQSTLYGRNANGGVVNFITKAPTEELEGSVSLGFAEYDQTELGAIINIPLSDNWGARLAVNHLERDEGFYKNIHPNEADSGSIDSATGARLTIAGDLSDAVRLTLKATSSEAETSLEKTVTLDTSYNPFFATQTRTSGDFEVAQGTPGLTDASYTGLSATLDWSLGEWALKSITATQDFRAIRTADFDFLLVDSVVNRRDEDSSAFTQEFNFSGNIGNTDTVFGLFYLNEERVESSRFSFPAGFGPFAPSTEASFAIETPKYDLTSLAVFADATWNVSDSFRVLTGIRYSDDEQTAEQFGFQRGFRMPPPPPIAVNGVITTCPNLVTEVNGTSTIGRLGIQYDNSNNSNIYATYSEGLKTGGINHRSGCGDTFEDEQISSIELGWKTRSDDGRLSGAITTFFYDYEDLQTNQILGLSSKIENAPGAEVLGLEISGSWIPNDHWTIDANLSLLDASYSEDFLNGNAAIPGAPIVNVNGNALNYAPDVSTNISVGYTTDPILAGGTVDLRFDVNYRSEVALREFNLPGDNTDSITLLGLSAKWLSSSEMYSIRLYLDNATDEAFFEFASASSLNGTRFATWNTPRQLGVEFTANF